MEKKHVLVFIIVLITGYTFTEWWQPLIKIEVPKVPITFSGKELGQETQELVTKLQENVFPQLKTASEEFLFSLVNIDNALRLSIPIALFFILPLASYQGSRLGLHFLEKKLLNPQLILPNSSYGRLDRIRRWWSQYKTPFVILNESVNKKLDAIKEKVKVIKTAINAGKSLTYDNLLLHGPSGTGKSLIAQIIADYSNMDFLPVSAPSLLQSGILMSIKYLDQLFAMAQASSYGAVIFIDQADLLFTHRSLLKNDPEHNKVVSHLESLLSKNSNKYMIIASTTAIQRIDNAILPTFNDHLEIPLPDILSRIKLIAFYTQAILFNQKENTKLFIDQARTLLSKEYMIDIAQQIEGLSPADIKNMIMTIRKKSLTTHNEVPTQKIVSEAIAQAVEKRQTLHHYQSLRPDPA